MSQFDAKIVYVKGDNNTVTDALLRLPIEMAPDSMAAIQLAHAPYDHCEDDEDTTIYAVLPASPNCPLFSAHALAETDIATT